MGAPPLVSVVIPAYNGESFVDRALDSVAAQTLTDFEVVVVDDGSTDGTPECLARRAVPPLRVIRQANAGQSVARNRGAAEARGTYLAFLDQDDAWEPDYLREAVDCLARHPEAGLAAAMLRFTEADGSPTPRVVTKRSAGPVYTTRSLLEGDVGTIVNPLVRRDVFLAAGGYDPAIRGPEDCDLWLRLSFVTELRHVARPLLLYRLHPANTSKDVLENARAWLLVLDKLEREHPDFVAAHPELLRRNRAKQLLRLGRELVRAGSVQEARSVLARAIALRPARPKAWLYWLLAQASHAVPALPSAFAAWRRREIAMRERLNRSRVFSALARWRRTWGHRRRM